MLEVGDTLASVILCAADPRAVDAVSRSPGAWPVRIAPDEALLVAAPDAADDVLAAATSAALERDPDAVVIDATDGWSVWTISGGSREEAFARLSPMPLTGARWIQGPVAHVPAKVIVGAAGLHVLVPSMWRDHVRSLIHEECADLAPTEVGPHAWNEPSPGPETGA